MATAAGRVELRAATGSDRDFLREVYASTRASELAQTQWTDEQKSAFVAQQFDAQDSYYKDNYENATYDVVVVDGIPGGRLYVARWTEEIRIVDIALLPRARGQGVGTALLSRLLDEGRASGRRVSIHVEQFNAALRLYRRLGFRRVEDRTPYVLMEWDPELS